MAGQQKQKLQAMKTILSLFDYSGSWPEPYTLANGRYDVVSIDIKHGIDVNNFSCEYLIDTLELDMVHGILIGVPCTDFTNSGAQYWPAKDHDGRTAASVRLVTQALCCVEYFQPEFWALENPVGRLPKALKQFGGIDIGTPWYFDPYQFAGKADTAANLRYAKTEPLLKSFYQRMTPRQRKSFTTERYTKKTGLWGNFHKPELAPLPPIRATKQGSWLQKLGGKSEKTKALRSLTPTGFAQAFFEANP